MLCFQSHRHDCDMFWSVSQQVSEQACMSKESSSWVTLTSPRVHVCLMANGLGGVPTEFAEKEQTASHHYSLGDWVWRGHCYIEHIHPARSSGMLESFICTLRCRHINITHIHVHIICTPGRILKSLSASLRERPALMLISVRVSVHYGEKEKAKDKIWAEK